MPIARMASALHDVPLCTAWMVFSRSLEAPDMHCIVSPQGANDCKHDTAGFLALLLNNTDCQRVFHHIDVKFCTASALWSQ